MSNARPVLAENSTLAVERPPMNRGGRYRNHASVIGLLPRNDGLGNAHAGMLRRRITRDPAQQLCRRSRR